MCLGNLGGSDKASTCRACRVPSWCHDVCRVPYIMSLLQEGLSIAEEKLQVGNGREGWTLGAALAEGGRVGIGRPVLEQVRYECPYTSQEHNEGSEGNQDR